MNTSYHAGELAVQTRAGVQTQAARIGKGIRPIIPPVAQEFLHNQQMIIAGSVDSRGQVWASLLVGETGFLSTPDERTVCISSLPFPGDPLTENIHIGATIGLLAIDLATRRRMRINGRIEAYQPGKFVVHNEQVFANCHKYIQLRTIARDNVERQPKIARSNALTPQQQAWIAKADTFFIASAHPESGADASHRGGAPGFVHIKNSAQLIFPDYSGNTMFQTLGNMAVNPHVGLLFNNLMSGDILQLTGRAQILWDEQHTAAFAGAERVVEFTIDEVIEIAGASPLRGELLEYSPFNPDWREDRIDDEA